jgi:hypothetical protein
MVKLLHLFQSDIVDNEALAVHVLVFAMALVTDQLVILDVTRLNILVTTILGAARNLF